MPDTPFLSPNHLLERFEDTPLILTSVALLCPPHFVLETNLQTQDHFKGPSSTSLMGETSLSLLSYMEIGNSHTHF